MSEKGARQKVFLRYRSDDFLLYCVSLLATAAITWKVIDGTAAHLLLSAALAYLLWVFIIKHGCSMDWSTGRVLVSGMLSYPRVLLRSWWSVRSRTVQALLVFAIAIAVEMALRPLLKGTRWLDPFPWPWVVWVPFIAITVFRVTVLIAHLLRAGRVREVLLDSPIRGIIERGSLNQHIFQAFLTGLIAHLCMVAPCVLFYSMTKPSYLREALLLGGYVVWCCAASVAKAYVPRESGGDGHPWRRYALFRLFRETHGNDHRSRFYFTLFHGHHHDAIPSAMIGAAGGTGFLESTERGLSWLDFLDSALVVQFYWLGGCLSDMLGHQYIPGVFPFSRATTVASCNHHVTHHFGSLMPLGFVAKVYTATEDFADGYRPDNPRTRWFLGMVERYEGLSEPVRDEFMSFGAPREG